MNNFRFSTLVRLLALVLITFGCFAVATAQTQSSGIGDAIVVINELPMHKVQTIALAEPNAILADDLKQVGFSVANNANDADGNLRIFSHEAYYSYELRSSLGEVIVKGMVGYHRFLCPPVGGMEKLLVNSLVKSWLASARKALAASSP